MELTRFCRAEHQTVPHTPLRRRERKGKYLARTSLEYPLELHRKVKKYAVDAGMKEKQVIAQAIREFFERVEKE